MESFSNFIELNEIFDKKLELHRDRDLENAVNSVYYPHTLTNVEVYHTEHHGTPYKFFRFKHKNAWEVHFSRADDASTTGTERLNSHKGSATSELVGTAIHLYKEKLDRGHPVRYFGDDNKLNHLYDKAFHHISKKHYNGSLYKHKIKNFIDSQGNKYDATEIHNRDPEGTVHINEILDSNYISPYIKLE